MEQAPVLNADGILKIIETEGKYRKPPYNLDDLSDFIYYGATAQRDADHAYYQQRITALETALTAISDEAYTEDEHDGPEFLTCRFCEQTVGHEVDCPMQLVDVALRGAPETKGAS